MIVLSGCDWELCHLTRRYSRRRLTAEPPTAASRRAGAAELDS